MTKQPNILLITTDQQRFDTTGDAAPSFLRTPHLDVLAREGVTFSRAYSDCPICVAARVGIMTGQFVGTHGMRGNGSTSDVLDRNSTLPALLRQAGYQTAAIGKMHFTPERARHGFDEMILPADYYREMACSGSPLQPMHHGLGQNELYPGMATVPEAQTLTSWISEQCVEYIKERRDPSVPFFLWCSYTKPHPPLDPPEPYYSMYRNSPIPEPFVGDWAAEEQCPEAFARFRQSWSLDKIPAEIIREARAAYYGLITQIDYNMGRVLAALQDEGMLEDTLIVFTSDHGEHLGDHNTGGKVFFTESSAHVPFILRLPKSWERRMHGTTCAVPVTFADILPTLLTAAAAEIPQSTDGMDLTALARGDLSEPRRFVEVMCDTEPSYLGITDGRWKYTWFPEGEQELLFDLDSDPHELNNLAMRAEYREHCEQLHSQLVARDQQRGGQWSHGQRLLGRPRRGDSERDRRNRSWPGFHTEHFPVDVRH